jgi:hypothetical protein
MFKINSLGKRPEYFNEKTEYEAFEVLHQPLEGDAWPQGPVFPEGHILTMDGGVKYEIVVPETVESKDPGVPGGSRYAHRYVCRLATKDSL